MQTFRIMYFRENVFEHSEVIEVTDILEAIDLASSKPPDLRAEVWSDKGRVAELDASPMV